MSSVASIETAPMIRVLFVILLCAFSSSQATARNDPSEILLALSEDERNAAFTHLLQESNEKCNRVIRTLFDGTVHGLDNWEAKLWEYMVIQADPYLR